VEQSGDGAVLDTALTGIPRAFCALSGARAAVLFAVDEASLSLEACAAHGLPDNATCGLRLELAAAPNAVEALRTQRPVICRGKAGDGPVRALGFGLHTCVPIVSEDVPVGMVLLDGLPRLVRLGTSRRLCELAGLAAPALVAVRAHRRASAERDGTRSLVEAARSIFSSRDVREVLSRIAWAICTLMHAPRSAIAMYEPATSMLYGAAGYGVDGRRLTALRTELHRSRIAQVALLSGRLECAADFSGVADPVGDALGFDPTYCLPLLADNELLGVIYIDASLKGQAPAQLDRALITDFAAVAATAVQNARAYRRARTPVALAQACYAARDLHDGIAQQLYAIGAIASRLVSADGLLSADRREPEQIAKLVAKALQELREAIRVLSGDRLTFVGLGAALAALAAETRERTGLRIELDVEPPLSDADGTVAELLYRACREALTNIERHAAAASCSIHCSVRNGWAIAVVEDDGRSFDGVSAREHFGRGHFGLAFLREAFEAFDGTIEVHPREPTGTVFVAQTLLTTRSTSSAPVASSFQRVPTG
jgi:GAF domain-containing protein